MRTICRSLAIASSRLSGDRPLKNLCRELYVEKMYLGINRIGTYIVEEDSSVSDKYCLCNFFLSTNYHIYLIIAGPLQFNPQE